VSERRRRQAYTHLIDGGTERVKTPKPK